MRKRRISAVNCDPPRGVPGDQQELLLDKKKPEQFIAPASMH